MSRFLTGLFAALALLISGVPAAAQSIGYSPNTLPLSGSCGVVTVSTPCLDLTQTWNNVATAFTGLKLNVTDTASAAGSLMDLQVGGATKFNVSKSGNGLFAGSVITNVYADTQGFGRISLTPASGAGSALYFPSGNAIEQRNGTAAQAFNVYNTYTDASNYERAVLGWSGNALIIGTDNLGTGTLRATTLTGSTVSLKSGATSRWQVDTSGNYITFSDNTYDIGAVGANRPRTGYFGTSVSVGAGYGWLNSKGAITQAVDGAFTFSNFAGTNSVTATIGASNILTLNGGLTTGGAVTLPATQYVGFNTRSSIRAPATGNILLADWVGTSFGLLQFGGTTSSFPAIKRSTTGLQVRLADDSAFAPLASSTVTTSDTAFLHNTSAALANGAAAQLATMTNGPTAGNPTKWIAINDNGTTRYIPAW